MKKNIIFLIIYFLNLIYFGIAFTVRYSKSKKITRVPTAVDSKYYGNGISISSQNKPNQSNQASSTNGLTLQTLPGHKSMQLLDPDFFNKSSQVQQAASKISVNQNGQQSIPLQQQANTVSQQVIPKTQYINSMLVPPSPVPQKQYINLLPQNSHSNGQQQSGMPVQYINNGQQQSTMPVQYSSSIPVQYTNSLPQNSNVRY